MGSSAKPVKGENSRRRFLKLVGGIVIVAVAGAVAGILKLFPMNSPPVSTSSTQTSVAPITMTASEATSQTVTTSASSAVSQTVALAWPRLKVINVKLLVVGNPLSFNYPLTNTPNMIVKLGVKADNGVGPDGDVVAFSIICQHQGCSIGFDGTVGVCPCHGSRYDLVQNGSVINGPTTQPVPRVLLEYDGATGDIYVVGMGPPVIYGQGPLGDTNPADLLQDDLQGRQIVTQITPS